MGGWPFWVAWFAITEISGGWGKVAGLPSKPPGIGPQGLSQGGQQPLPSPSTPAIKRPKKTAFLWTPMLRKIRKKMHTNFPHCLEIDVPFCASKIPCVPELVVPRQTAKINTQQQMHQYHRSFSSGQ